MWTSQPDIETHTVTRDGATLTIRIVPDEDPMSPRDWDNLGVMFCAHPRYNLGDEQINPGDFESEEDLVAHLQKTHDPRVMLRLYLLDHSGLSMRAGSASPFDPGGWDTSVVGFILDTAETRAKMGCENYDETSIAAILHGEVRTYSTYLEGGVVGYIVEDEHGEILDSCHGFFEVSDAREQGIDAAEWEANRLAPIRRTEAAYRRAADSPVDRVIHEVADDAPVEVQKDGALVTVKVFVPSHDAAEFLDPTPTT